jgi:four helix bundle protein
MAASLEDLRVLKLAEELADGIWKLVDSWDAYSREAVGLQLVKAADSIGANIAESFGRYHSGEKLQFLYYARGSLFETKYWINRAAARSLCATDIGADFAERLGHLARQLNTFAASIKAQRGTGSSAVKEQDAIYSIETIFSAPDELLDLTSQNWLQAEPPTS